MDEIVGLVAINAVQEAENLNAVPQRRFHVRDDPFHTLSNSHFQKTYRLSKPLVEELINSVRPYLPQPSRISALDAETKVLTTLNFLAYGSYQLNIGQNINCALSQSSVSRAINEVTDAISRPEIMNRYVYFPRNFEEMQEIRTRFYENRRFPGVIGCIDCTHIAIYPPPRNDPVYPEHIYVNRKGYHSVNTQVICDANLKILNVNSRFPGSAHDSFIWRNSNILTFMQQLHQQGHKSYYLLGDSGYPLRTYLLTPFQNAIPNTREASYNERHCSTRSYIEQCNGVLKSRFRCLLKHRVLHYAPERASKILNTCTVLHNICINNNLPHIPPEPGDANIDYGMFNQEAPENANRNGALHELNRGRAQRNILVGNHFRI